MRQASYNEVRMDPELKGRLIESGYALVPTMISEKSSTLFAPANIRLTRSQRRGILISPLGHCVWGENGGLRLLPIDWPDGPQTVKANQRGNKTYEH